MDILMKSRNRRKEKGLRGILLPTMFMIFHGLLIKNLFMKDQKQDLELTCILSTRKIKSQVAF